jgi:hypothetical protein
MACRRRSDVRSEPGKFATQTTNRGPEGPTPRRRGDPCRSRSRKGTWSQRRGRRRRGKQQPASLHCHHRRPPTHYLTHPTPPLEETTMRRAPGRRTGSPPHAAIRVARTTTRGNSPKSVAAAKSTSERELESGRRKLQGCRRRSPTSAAVGDTHAHPIYTARKQIRGSPTLSPPERTQKGRGTHGGAGENGGTGRPCFAFFG